MISPQHLRNAGFRGPVKFLKAPLFKLEDAPFKRAGLCGFQIGDKIWLSVAGKPGQRRKGVIINILPRMHSLIIRAENPDAIVSINPIVHGFMVAKRHHSLDEGEARP